MLQITLVRITFAAFYSKERKSNSKCIELIFIKVPYPINTLNASLLILYVSNSKVHLRNRDCNLLIILMLRMVCYDNSITIYRSIINPNNKVFVTIKICKHNLYIPFPLQEKYTSLLIHSNEKVGF